MACIRLRLIVHNKKHVFANLNLVSNVSKQVYYLKCLGLDYLLFMNSDRIKAMFPYWCIGSDIIIGNGIFFRERTP